MAYVVAVDFDGTLCESAYPEIGEPNDTMINLMIAKRKAGAKIALNTCREGAMLDAAVAWCRERGLEFDAVNDNVPELIEKWGNNPRKIAAAEYWDDRNKLVLKEI